MVLKGKLKEFVESETILQSLSFTLESSYVFFFTIALNMFSSLFLVYDLAFLLNERVLVFMCLVLHYLFHLQSILWFSLPKRENFTYFLCCITFISIHMPCPQEHFLALSPFTNTESEIKILLVFYCHIVKLIICIFKKQRKTSLIS